MNDLEVQITNTMAEMREEVFDIGGKHYCWNSFKFPFRTSSGQRLIGGIAIDITESKRREEEQRKLERQLVRAQRMESVGTLASGIAHAFNNILSVIAGNADILANSQPGPEKLQRRVAAIAKASERGASVVKQLLAVAGQTDIRHQAVDMNSVILDLIELLEETFPKTVGFTLDLAQGLPPIIGDQGQLHQMLLNLCLNARDALPEGGTIRLATSTASGGILRPRFPEAGAHGYVLVSVQDNGIGIDESVQKRIFDPFFTTKVEGHGVGLGLAVTSGIIQSHAGYVDLTSAPGSGTVFDIYLPVSTKEVLALDPLQSSAPVRGGGETILFIEDEDSITEVVAAMFPGFGYTMIFAGDGRDGVEQFRRHRNEIALVISDYGLPAFDGEEVYRRIRELDPDVPFALVTGYIASEKREDLIARGVTAMLSKPYKPKELLTVVRRLLDGAAA